MARVIPYSRLCLLSYTNKTTTVVDVPTKFHVLNSVCVVGFGPVNDTAKCEFVRLVQFTTSLLEIMKF